MEKFPYRTEIRREERFYTPSNKDRIVKFDRLLSNRGVEFNFK